jgi:hypothetical protein
MESTNENEKCTKLIIFVIGMQLSFQGGNKKLILMYAQSVRYTVKNTDNREQKIDKKSQQL